MKSPRQLLRDSLFRIVRKASATDDAREIASRTLAGLLNGRPGLTTLNGRLKLAPLPYRELGGSDASPGLERGDVVFITARFRSGSTLLWNLFRHLPGCTAYYEPFNERRWFDPAARGDRIDRTHRGVDDYWREYEELEELGRYYRPEWIDHQLLMEAEVWAPDMKRYIELLIDRAPGRPVLQFNRVDFRLPWLRRNFPNAKILHLYRHPRDQWCSTLLGDNYPRDASPDFFLPHDHFYLLRWARDLRYHFPFLQDSLARHPYETFYLVWRLSYLYGINYAHHSLAFERLIEDADATLTDLLTFIELDVKHKETLMSLIERPRIGQWRNYADPAWFADIESRCEETLAEFFGRTLVSETR